MAGSKCARFATQPTSLRVLVAGKRLLIAFAIGFASVETVN